MLFDLPCSGPVLIAVSLSAAVLYLTALFRRSRKKRKPIPDVVVLYQLGRGPNTPSVSPFPLKLETFLRMAKVPYQNDHSGRFSSKGKTPWIEYNGKAVADSQFCIEHLKEKMRLDVNEHLTEEQIATGRAFQKMVEEELYWTMCSVSFGDDLSAVEKIMPYTGFKLWFVTRAIRRTIRKEMWYHGIGRHSAQEIWHIALRDLRSLSVFLGNKPFFLGTEPGEADCAFFGMMAQVLWNMKGSPHETLMTGELTNLVSYCHRMKERFWPDWDTQITSKETFVNDHGKLYQFN